MLKRLLMALALVSVCSTGLMAQEVFLTFGLEAAARTATDITVDETVTSGSVFLYATLGINFQAFDVEAVSSNAGVAEITSATVFNPDIVPFPFGADSQTRFTNFDPVLNDPGADIYFAATDATTVSLVGVSVFPNNLGVLDAAQSGDSMYDRDANAFLVAEINYDIVGEGSAEFSLNTTDISFLESSYPTSVFISPTLGNATLTVGTAVPEPSTVGLLAFGVVGMVARRRR